MLPSENWSKLSDFNFGLSVGLSVPSPKDDWLLGRILERLDWHVVIIIPIANRLVVPKHANRLLENRWRNNDLNALVAARSLQGKRDIPKVFFRVRPVEKILVRITIFCLHSISQLGGGALREVPKPAKLETGAAFTAFNCKALGPS